MPLLLSSTQDHSAAAECLCLLLLLLLPLPVLLVALCAWYRDGHKIDSSVHTKIPTWLISQKMGFNMSATSTLNTAAHHAFYDKVDNRYVIIYNVIHFDDEAAEGDPPSHVVVCVSRSNNPLGKWTCWALDAVPLLQPNYPMCAGMPLGAFIAESSQVRPKPPLLREGFRHMRLPAAAKHRMDCLNTPFNV
jgi:hypothetical protein